MNTDPQLRDLAVSMFKQGRSSAEVWEALTSNGMETSAAEALVRELLELRRQAEAATAPAPAPNIYAPPIAPVVGWEQPADQGQVWKGVVAGLICGCWAILAVIVFPNDRIGSETKKGIYIGFVINFIVGVLYAITQRH